MGLQAPNVFLGNHISFCSLEAPAVFYFAVFFCGCAFLIESGSMHEESSILFRSLLSPQFLIKV